MYPIILELRPMFNLFLFQTLIFINVFLNVLKICNEYYFNGLYFFFQENKTLRLNETHLVEVNVVSRLKWVLFSCAYMYVEI